MSNEPPQYAEYPRPQLIDGQREAIVGLDVISESFTAVNQKLGVYLPSALLLVVLYALLNYVPPLLIPGMQPNFSSKGSDAEMWGALTTYLGLSMAIGIPSALLQQVLVTGLALMAVRQRRGYEISVADMFLPFRSFGSVLGASFLYMVLLYVGFILCFVPGIYASAVLAFATLIAVDRQAGPIEAIKLSYETLKPQWGMMFVVVFLGGLVACAGLLACGIGVLYTLPIYAVVVGLTYHRFFPYEPGVSAPAYAPPVYRD